jgi:hypothetical protein
VTYRCPADAQHNAPYPSTPAASADAPGAPRPPTKRRGPPAPLTLAHKPLVPSAIVDSGPAVPAETVAMVSQPRRHWPLPPARSATSSDSPSPSQAQAPHSIQAHLPQPRQRHLQRVEHLHIRAAPRSHLSQAPAQQRSYTRTRAKQTVLRISMARSKSCLESGLVQRTMLETGLASYRVASKPFSTLPRK